MVGGILQLVATGMSDIFLTGDPQITWFKLVYRRHTEFSMMDFPIKIKGDLQFGETGFADITPVADLLNRLTLVVDVPTPDICTKAPTVFLIQKILNDHCINVNLENLLSRRSSDVITHEDLFGYNDDGPLSTIIYDNAEKLNRTYERKKKY